MDEEEYADPLFGEGTLSYYTGALRESDAELADGGEWAKAEADANPLPPLEQFPSLGAIRCCPPDFSVRWAEAQRQVIRYYDITGRFVDTSRVYRGHVCPQLLPGWFCRTWWREWVLSLFELSVYSFRIADDCFACIEAATRYGCDIDGLRSAPRIASQGMNACLRIDRIFQDLAFLARPGRFTPDQIEYLTTFHETQLAVSDDDFDAPEQVRDHILDRLWDAMLLLGGSAEIPERPRSIYRGFAEGLCRVHSWLIRAGYRKSHGAGDDRPPTESRGVQHGPDFGWLRCEHGEFTFSGRQRMVIEELIKDWKAKGMGVSGQYLLVQVAESNSPDLKDLFKGNPAWGKLLVRNPDRKDLYRLDIPPCDPVRGS
ncbi:MAG: hypothetical protein JWO38_6133 [Gemmataceae bacterium]|nr:hypothetical protein [Gemmataceae bacterium]